MTRGPIIRGGPPIEIYISLILLAVSLLFSITGIIKKSENTLLPGISFALAIAFGIFHLFILYLV